MRTRHEQVQAHRFVTRRIVSALLSGEPETTELPMRRLGMAIFGSVMVATIVFAGIGVYGLLSPGGGKPADGAIIIERESGARFVYENSRLYPVLNYASARLVVGSATPAVNTVSGKSLRGLPRGLPLGIPGAPDALPDKSALVQLPWQVCDGPQATDNTKLTSDVMVGSELPSGTALGDDEAVLVEVNGGADGRYLIWQGHRLRVPDRITLAALNLAAVTALPVDNTLINGVPAGPDLTVPAIPQMGANSNKLIFGKPAQIGKVYKNGKQYYVLLSDGLAPIGEVTADLLLAGGARAQDISSATAGKATGNGNVEPAGMPHTVPTVRQARTGTTICAAYRAGADPTAQRVTVSTYDQIPQPLTQNEQGSVSAPRPSVDGVQTADRILVPGGRGALVRVLPAPGVTATTTAYLVTDQGIKYPLSKSGGDAQAFLGYADVTPTPIDASLLALVPTGPALDAAAARNFNVNVGPSTTPGPTKPATGG